MYIGVDIGGTKTLIATLSDNGEILESQKFPSNSDYSVFLKDLKNAAVTLKLADAVSCVAGVAGHLDRTQGVVLAVGNLPWRNQPIRDDIAAILHLPVTIENDSRLAGLSEASLLQNVDSNILYLTISTGIGGALIQDSQIDTELQDMEIGKIPLLYEDQILLWEEFAGGGAILKKYGKLLSEIDDSETLQKISENIAIGVAIGCSIMQPEVVIFGGGAGAHAYKFIPTVQEYLKAHLHPNVPGPKALVTAQHPEEAVIYGCYLVAKATAQK